MKKTLLVIVAVVLVLPGIAGGAGVRESINAAATGYSQGDFAKSLDHLRVAAETMWKEAPLTAHNLTFVTAPPQGFRQFQAKPDNVFEAIDPIQLYLEPIGCILKKEGQVYRVAVSADFVVIDDKGTVLGGQKGIDALKAEVPTFTPDIMMTLTFVPKGLPSGKYKLVVVLHDKNSDKTGKLEKDFIIK